jgi:hypothetical protein
LLTPSGSRRRKTSLASESETERKLPLPDPEGTQPRNELLAILVLVALVLAGTLPLIGGGIIAGIDNLDFFYPMLSFLGEQLRAGNIPGWNPYQFSGMPFAADPESGWTYLPAMLFFTTLPLVPAATVLMLFHFLVAALTMYAFARMIGISILGALVAAIGFAFSYFFYSRSVCCPAHIFVLTWIPSILLFVCLASRARTWLPRMVCWAAAGLALSQVLAAWLGQASYYALLFTAGFVSYRELCCPPRARWSLLRRTGRIALSLAAVFAWAAGFAAAGVLPRLEFVNASNLAGGYRGIAATQGGLSVVDAVTFPFLFGGVAIVVLAMMAPVLARRRFLTPFFAATAVVALLLALRITTPLHAVAVLAGVTVASTSRWPRLQVALLTFVFATIVAVNLGVALPPSRHLDLAAYYRADGAAEYLRSRQEDDPFRYFGYDPQAITLREGQEVRYLWHMFDAQVTALLVNNRATLFHLDDVQGYNPLQLQRYVEFFDRMNGEAQEYHGRYVLPSGLDSPLLDLLNARFIVIPARFTADRAGLQSLVETHPRVYGDDLVMVFENRDALPRAWIVHEARQVEEAAALDPIASGAVDARTTALLETTPPPLAPATDPTQDVALIEHYEPDAIRVRTRTDAAGLLLLSEIFYPAWNAYVDGNSTPIYRADHILRAVPLPEGEHVVELRYESAPLRIGLIVSLIAVTVFVTLIATLGVRTARSRTW